MKKPSLGAAAALLTVAVVFDRKGSRTDTGPVDAWVYIDHRVEPVAHQRHFDAEQARQVARHRRERFRRAARCGSSRWTSP